MPARGCGLRLSGDDDRHLEAVEELVRRAPMRRFEPERPLEPSRWPSRRCRRLGGDLVGDPVGLGGAHDARGRRDRRPAVRPRPCRRSPRPPFGPPGRPGRPGRRNPSRGRGAHGSRSPASSRARTPPRASWWRDPSVSSATSSFSNMSSPFDCAWCSVRPDESVQHGGRQPAGPDVSRRAANALRGQIGGRWCADLHWPVKGARITVQCDCGKKSLVAYGAVWQCEGCRAALEHVPDSRRRVLGPHAGDAAVPHEGHGVAARSRRVFVVLAVMFSTVLPPPPPAHLRRLVPRSTCPAGVSVCASRLAACSNLDAAAGVSLRLDPTATSSHSRRLDGRRRQCPSRHFRCALRRGGRRVRR